MTQRLYYDDPALLTFEAVIVSSVKQGDGWQTILDRSAFYPTSGGQMHDTGLLNGVLVTDVRETDNDEVVHVTAAPVGEPGGDVSGAVDPARRRKHRQTHTAQHILSAVFFRLYDLNTVSVHL
ncbi:MAG: alanyl-tRNA editing protein, partial [candidate division Zixibacteria bacterium]|nr:alanyl-tRNA editing protein [candidate division Zixibacteria bacterium]